ncbi:MAG TPA: molybdenum cofactor guanylyltransferase [Polyangiaceae bacterium]|nr:molybdenum cofactor guanylyltransferase [Polyangiaceae bacterium]
MTATVLGIFVGGRARRMGGFPKGLLPASRDGESIVRHLVRLADECDMDPVFAGDASPYVDVALDVAVLADCPAGVGPLGGLVALLAHAGDRAVITLACDMPFVTGDLLRRLRDAPCNAAIVAARRTEVGPFEPFLARYDAVRVAPVLADQLRKGARSFQELFARFDIEPWPLTADERAMWNDWDTPNDLPAWARPRQT